MKKILFSFLCLCCCFRYSEAQTDSVYHFKKIFEVAADSVISQGRSGTCWSFATTSFLESEIYRETHHWIDLSEMYNIRMLYPLKMANYISRQGHAQFGPGGLSHDVLVAFSKFGAVPESIYFGSLNDSHIYFLTPMYQQLQKLADSAVNDLNTRMTWREKADSILNETMGQPPTHFKWEGKDYTPLTFAATLPISPKDYVEFTSFAFQPYYSKFILNIPDNYNNGAYWNVPLDSLTSMINAALRKGFSVALDCDVSEKDFLRHPIQIAIYPLKKEADFIHHIVPEKWITPQERVKDFWAYRTTDDHLMQIVGLYQDRLGNQYYKVKNSWGTDYAGKGYWMISQAYIRAKTIGIMINKAAVNKAIADQTYKKGK